MTDLSKVKNRDALEPRRALLAQDFSKQPSWFQKNK
jgi:hypothetical protein